MIGLIGSFFDKKEGKSSAIPEHPHSLHEQSASNPKLATAKKNEIEGQSATGRVDLPLTPSRKIDDDYLALKSTDGRTIRGKILSLSTISVVVRRDDGLTFDIPLSILDADSKQRIEAAERSSLPLKGGGRSRCAVFYTPGLCCGWLICW